MKRIYLIFLFLCLTTLTAYPAHAQAAVLYNFQGSPDGANPQGKLASHKGSFYGVTNAGGTGGLGAVFELTPNDSGNWKEKVLYSFCSLPNCADGSTPTYAYVIFDKLGNMYGTTWAGGANNYGVVWELSLSGSDWTETVLYNFQNGNGVSGLVMNSSGKLFGCTYDGPGAGSVFELARGKDGWSERVIYSIDETYAGLAIDAAGNLFGSTLGTVFEVSPNGSGDWSGSIIYNFDGDENGEFEVPTLDTAGNIYGTTESGGRLDYGGVWKLVPVTSGPQKGTWTETLVYSFQDSPKDGDFPYGGIVLDTAGNMYGTTLGEGAYNRGTVFELVPVGGYNAEETFLWSFNFTEGASPYDSLILDSSGKLYGTAYQGGTNSAGVVFEVNPSAAATTTTLSSSPNPSTEGEAVTFTAVVTPAPPDGEIVSFTEGTAPVIVLGTGPLSGGVATFSYSDFPVGYPKVTAEYGGDLAFVGSTSNTVKQVVNK